MGTNFPRLDRDAALQSLEIRPRMAKVHSSSLQRMEISEYREWLGKCIARAIQLSTLTLDQFADAIDRDTSQVSKWTRNTEPPQADPILNSSMRGFLLTAMAERTDCMQVTTVISITRTA